MHSGMCGVHKVAANLVWVGALNWGLVGIFNFNLVAKLLGAGSTAERVVYILVGVGALLMPLMCVCSRCKGGNGGGCCGGNCKEGGCKNGSCEMKK